MRGTSISKKSVGTLAALALCTASTGAIASSSQQASQPAAISPLVALSALGSDASRAALCGASAVAAAGATAVAQGVGPGCVLPILDTPPPPQVVETLPPPPVPPPPVAPVGGGFGISPLLLALAGIAAAVLLVTLLGNKDKDEVSPA